MEGTIMEFFKWFFILIFLMVLSAASLFFYEVGQTNRFNSFVAAEVERGGMYPVQKGSDWVLEFTPEAEARIKKENKEVYRGRYTWTLTSKFPTPVVDYGDQVRFETKGTYKIMFADSIFNGILSPELTDNGVSTIQVRQIEGRETDGEYIDAKTALEYVEKDLLSSANGIINSGNIAYYNQDIYGSLFKTAPVVQINGVKYVTQTLAAADAPPNGVTIVMNAQVGTVTSYAVVKYDQRATHDAKIKSFFSTSWFTPKGYSKVVLGDGVYALYTFAPKL